MLIESFWPETEIRARFRALVICMQFFQIAVVRFFLGHTGNRNPDLRLVPFLSADY